VPDRCTREGPLRSRFDECRAEQHASALSGNGFLVMAAGERWDCAAAR